MEYKNIRLEVKDRICAITVNRPPVNAINAETYQELTDAFAGINFRDDVSVVVFQGEGRGFIAGNDINDIKLMTKENHHAYQDVLCGCALRLILIASLENCMAMGGLPVISFASANASFCKSSSFTTRLIPPKPNISSAVRGLPVSAIYLTTLSGTIRLKKLEPDTMLKVTSGMPNFVPSDAMTISQAAANTSPAPSANL